MDARQSEAKPLRTPKQTDPRPRYQLALLHRDKTTLLDENRVMDKRFVSLCPIDVCKEFVDRRRNISTRET